MFLHVFTAEMTDFTKSVFKLESEDQHKKRMAILDKREDDLGRHKQRKSKRETVRVECKMDGVWGPG